jgi:hypothetical protein
MKTYITVPPNYNGQVGKVISNDLEPEFTQARVNLVPRELKKLLSPLSSLAWQ